MLENGEMDVAAAASMVDRDTVGIVGSAPNFPQGAPVGQRDHQLARRTGSRRCEEAFRKRREQKYLKIWRCCLESRF